MHPKASKSQEKWLSLKTLKLCISCRFLQPHWLGKRIQGRSANSSQIQLPGKLKPVVSRNKPNNKGHPGVMLINHHKPKVKKQETWHLSNHIDCGISGQETCSLWLVISSQFVHQPWMTKSLANLHAASQRWAPAANLFIEILSEKKKLNHQWYWIFLDCFATSQWLIQWFQLLSVSKLMLASEEATGDAMCASQSNTLQHYTSGNRLPQN